MSLNTQKVQMIEISSGNVVITSARSISVLSTGGVTTVSNEKAQEINADDGTTVDMQCDSGNTMETITITPQSGALSQIVTVGGTVVINP